MRVQRRTHRLITFTVCLLAIAVSSLAAPLPQAIQKLEADGNLTDARARLGELRKAAQDKAEIADIDMHIGFVDNTIAALDASNLYAQHGLVQQAVEMLKAYALKLAEPREAYLALTLQRRISALQSQLAAESVAREALARADALFARKQYKTARETYLTVSAMTDPISDASKDRARRGVASAARSEFAAEPVGAQAQLFRSLQDGGRTLAQWLLTLLAFVPVIVLLWIVRRVYLTNTRTLELVDLTLQVPAPAANRELAQELEDVLDRIRLAGPGSAKLDASGAGESPNEAGENLPPPELVFVTPPVDAPELASDLEKFVSSTPTINVGPFGVNPQQLWAFGKKIVTPRARHAFIGTLTAYNNTLTLRLTSEDRMFGTKTEWRATASSASAAARITCLVDVACRIILDGRSTPTVTADCPSLKAYILGLYTLSTTNTPDAVKTAIAHFQEALDRDAGNWLARFQLALCARSRKDARTAIRHLTWFDGPEAALSASLQRHLERHPDFPHVVKYQLASTLALQSETREDTRVGSILDELIALEDNAADRALDPGKRLRLVMLARSGQSTREAVRASLLRDKSTEQEQMRQARERLRDHLDWFNRHADDLQRAAPTGHALSRGIVLHAYGRIQFASGDRNGAIESLSEAVELLTDYADVHVDLAKAYLERKGTNDWPQRVTSLLDRALVLDPANSKAQFVYARFYFAEETRDFTKAEPYLVAAPFDPTSLFMLAQVLISRGSYAETLNVLERAIALQKKGPTFRVRLYAESLLELTKVATDPKPRPREIEEGRRQLCEYDKLFDDNDRNSRNYQRVAQLYTQICAALNVQPAGQCYLLQAGEKTD